MKQILQKGIILFISVLICLFVSCFPHRSEPRHPKSGGIIVEPITSRVLRSKSVKIVTQDWDTYVAERRAEGYTLRDVRESDAWLKENAPDSSIDTGSNHKYNIRSVTTLTTQAGTHKGIVLIVNDDAGKLRVFQK